MGPRPPGSGLIEEVHRDWFEFKGLASRTTPFGGSNRATGAKKKGKKARKLRARGHREG